VTGLTWTSSDPTIVSLSTDDPPILTAVAAGHVTITAGAASADVTVSDPTLLPGGPLPLGTVIWSNPGDGSGVNYIVPAVPSTSGVADVFAFQADGTVQAITSDGTTAWTANVANAWPVLPDFQGGLVVLNVDPNTNVSSIYKLDGITGQPYPAYTPSPDPDGTSPRLGPVAIHPDGTIFAVQSPGGYAAPGSVIGIDPATGTSKFTVPLETTGSDRLFGFEVSGMIIAGDGYAYVPYQYAVCDDFISQDFHLGLLRVDSGGAYNNISVFDWSLPVGINPCEIPQFSEIGLITNADQGTVLTWETWENGSNQEYMAVTTGASASLVSAPQAPGGGQVVPVLQAQDGSFVGTAQDPNTGNNYMVAFDASGNVRWIVPNETPQIATADGGVIGQSGITYDQNGNATGQIGLSTQTWTGNMYQEAGSLEAMAVPSVFEAGASFWPTVGGNPSGNGTAFIQCPCLLQSTDTADPDQLESALRDGQAALMPQDQQGPTYLLLVGQPGIEYNAGQSFVLAAETASAALTQSGASSNSVPVLVSTVSDFAAALTGNGFITGGVTPLTTLGMNGPIAGGVTFFGHGGWLDLGGGVYDSALFLSPTRGSVYNLWIQNVGQLSNANLGTNATIVLYACNAGKNRNAGDSIAQLVANQLRRTVWAYPVDMWYSADPTPRIMLPVGRNADGTPIWPKVKSTTPLYMVPNANGVKAIPFYPH
jgi:hypothetical protein